MPVPAEADTLMDARAEISTTSEQSRSLSPEKTTWSQRLTTSRTAQRSWVRVAISDRMPIFRRFAALVGHRADELAGLVMLPQRTVGETFASELAPLADAAHYVCRHAPRLLRSRRESRSGRPIWGRGLNVETRREPWGVVLIVGPGNYPLFLPGVQMLQALAAGNSVLIKPGRDATGCALALRMLFVEAGGDPRLVQILSEDPEDVHAALEAGVDHVVMTGSTVSGRAVLRRTAETLTPATMELSGCDAVFVQGDADIELAARAIAFGLTFNGSATCMAPRRIFVHRQRQADLMNALSRYSADWVPRSVAEASSALARRLIAEAQAGGASIAVGKVPDSDNWEPVILTNVRTDMSCTRTDVFAPLASVLAVDDDEHALELSRQCPYALSASVFGESRSAARFARRVPVGTVVVNDLLAPTADPRVSFAAWDGSGFGATRGPEGLRQMTRTNVIVQQNGRWRPHLDTAEAPVELLRGLMNFSHGHGLAQRCRGLMQLIRAGWRQARHAGDENLTDTEPEATIDE